jgi:uncharacterized protein (DUF2384 family)
MLKIWDLPSFRFEFLQWQFLRYRRSSSPNDFHCHSTIQRNVGSMTPVKNHFSAFAKRHHIPFNTNSGTKKNMLRKEHLLEFTPDERALYSGPGMRALLALKNHWRLTDSNLSRMLGRPSRTELKEWLRAAEAGERIIISSERLHRISTILKVFDTLSKRFGGAQEKASRWLRAPHTAAVFSGKTPLNSLEHTDINTVLAVRNYISTWKIHTEEPKKSKK